MQLFSFDYPGVIAEKVTCGETTLRFRQQTMKILTLARKVNLGTYMLSTLVTNDMYMYPYCCLH